VKFVADDHPDAIGQDLVIEVGNYGDNKSRAAFDPVEAYYYVDTSRCYNDKKYLWEGKKGRGCSWIGKKAIRRRNKCKKSAVRAACPSLYGLDYCDDPTFKFKADNNVKKSCHWLSKNKDQEDRYCPKQLVKTQCAETYNFCFEKNHRIRFRLGTK